MAHHEKRAVTGILLLDKPLGLSSNLALQRVKRVYSAVKAGHTGSLDPMATGVLPVCLGEATKVSQFLLESNKRYCAVLKLGQSTSTGDKDGVVLADQPVNFLNQEDVERAARTLIGERDQVPPMYSALKYQGQPLYKLARQGVTVEREPRHVYIFRLVCNLQTHDRYPLITLDVTCSKGTYIRTLAEEIAAVLGTIGHLVALRRLQSGPFNIADVITLDRLESIMQTSGQAAVDSLLRSPELAISHLPKLELSTASAICLRQGQPVLVPNSPVNGKVRLAKADGEFVGIGEMLDDGRVAPRKIFLATT